METKGTTPFSGYQKIVIFILAMTQFTVILDFMVMSPLGDMLIKSLSMKPSSFGIAVYAYAFSAGISGFIMPLIGKLSDTVSKFRIFSIASIWTILICVAYTNLPATPFWIVIGLNVLMMIGIMSRMVPSSALTSAIPDMEGRAFMSINSSMQQIAGGIAAAASGMIVVQQTKFSPIEHYNIVGYVVVVVTLISIFLMYRVNQLAKNKPVAVAKTEEPELAISEF